MPIQPVELVDNAVREVEDRLERRSLSGHGGKHSVFGDTPSRGVEDLGYQRIEPAGEVGRDG